MLLMASLANCTSTAVDNNAKQGDSIATAPKNATAAEKEETFVEAHLTAEWQKDVKVLDACVSFTATEKSACGITLSEMQTGVVFKTDHTIRDFKVLALTFVDIVDGKAKFDVKELHTFSRLTPEQPLLLTTTFYGDIPNNGISYVDHTGKTRQFSVSESGKDGSVVLTEF